MKYNLYIEGVKFCRALAPRLFSTSALPPLAKNGFDNVYVKQKLENKKRKKGCYCRFTSFINANVSKLLSCTFALDTV
jgi:hypothetical protein